MFNRALPFVCRASVLGRTRLTLMLWGCAAGWASRSLQVIDLSDNPVQGSLPASWAAANTSISQSLRELYLHATLLEGSVPNSWSDNFPKLHLFTIWGSRMCGPPPQSTIGMGRWCIDPTRTSMGKMLLAADTQQAILPAMFIHRPACIARICYVQLMQQCCLTKVGAAY